MSFIRGRAHASLSDTQGRSRVPELGSLGSVRGVLSNEHPYPELVRSAGKGGRGSVFLRDVTDITATALSRAHSTYETLRTAAPSRRGKCGADRIAGQTRPAPCQSESGKPRRTG